MVEVFFSAGDLPLFDREDGSTTVPVMLSAQQIGV
jgi:hypothetical protein